MIPGIRSGLATEIGMCNSPLLVTRRLDIPFDTDWVARGPPAKKILHPNFFLERHLENPIGART